MTAHHVHRHADETSYILSCNCGLRRVYQTQVARDVAASEHSEFAWRRPWPQGKTISARLDPVTGRVVPVGDGDDAA